MIFNSVQLCVKTLITNRLVKPDINEIKLKEELKLRLTKIDSELSEYFLKSEAKLQDRQ